MPVAKAKRRVRQVEGRAVETDALRADDALPKLPAVGPGVHHRPAADAPGDPGGEGETGQAVPQGRGEISRVIYEGLALKYRWAIERLEQDMLGHPIKSLNIVGGGAKNVLLNKFTAEAIKRPVIAGPSEGTVIGNLLMQAMALGAIDDIWALRRVVEASFPTETFEPETDGKAWEEAYERYLKLFA